MPRDSRSTKHVCPLYYYGLALHLFDGAEWAQHPERQISRLLSKRPFLPYLDCLVISSIDSLHRHLSENHGLQFLFGKIAVVNDT